MYTFYWSRYVITTNYDNVLSNVYARREDGKHMAVIEYTNNIAVGTALFTGNPAIIKLHGCFNVGSNYIFTKEQYDASYNNSSFQKELERILTNRQLFFMGYSLVNERFLRTWKDIITKNEKLYHCAIMEMAENNEEQRKLKKISYGILYRLDKYIKNKKNLLNCLVIIHWQLKY